MRDLYPFFVLTLLLAACSSAAETQSPGPVATIDSLIVTQAATTPATRTPEPGFTLIAPTEPPLSVPPPTPCINDATFISDLTIPDFSQVLPGAALDKQWLVRNTGSCQWTADYRITFREGIQMTGIDTFAIYPAQPGTEGIIRIEMTAPDVPGEYTGRWELRAANGGTFGPVLFIKINVIPLPEESTGDS